MEQAKRVVVAWSGELDTDECADLDATLDAATAAGEVLCIDLGAVTFFGSAGIRTLVVAQRRARERGGDLCVGVMSATVQRVLTLTDLVDELACG